MKVLGSRIDLSWTWGFIALTAMMGFYLTMPTARGQLPVAMAVRIDDAWCAGDKCSDFFADSNNCANLNSKRCDFNNNLACLMCVSKVTWGCGINDPTAGVRCTGVCNADGVTPCNANVIQCTTNFPPPGGGGGGGGGAGGAGTGGV